MTNTGKNLEQLKTTTKRRMWRNWKRQQQKNVEKLEPSYITCRDVKWYSNNREQSGHPSKKLTIELPYDPTILLLYVYAGEMKTYVRNLYLMVVETWKPKIKLLTVLVSGESLLPALQAATFWMYPQMNERVSSNVFLCKGTNPTMGAPPSWPNLNLITSRHHTVGLGLQYMNSERGEDTKIQTITWCIHMMDHSASKRNESLIYAAMGMDLENIMLSEIGQTQKAPCYRVPFIWC